MCSWPICLYFQSLYARTYFAVRLSLSGLLSQQRATRVATPSLSPSSLHVLPRSPPAAGATRAKPLAVAGGGGRSPLCAPLSPPPPTLFTRSRHSWSCATGSRSRSSLARADLLLMAMVSPAAHELHGCCHRRACSLCFRWLSVQSDYYSWCKGYIVVALQFMDDALMQRLWLCSGISRFSIPVPEATRIVEK